MSAVSWAAGPLSAPIIPKTFHNPGTKFGGGGSSSPGSPDVSTASYSTNFDTANETTEPMDLQFNSDGTKLFVICDSTNKIFQYTTSNYSIASASYDSVFKDLSGTFATNINAFIFNGDGTSFYIMGNDQGGTTPDTIYQFDMSTAYDIANASYTKQGTTVGTGTTAVDNTPDKMIFNNDGTKIYITGRSTNQMYQFSLSTAYDISTISYDSVNMSIGVNTNYRKGMQWGHNGRKLYIIDGEGQTPLSLDVYSFTTPYDISTSGFNTSIDISGNGLTRPQGLALKPDGTGFIILDGHKTFATAKAFEFTTSAIAGGTPGENTGVTHSFGGGLVLSWSVQDDNVQTSERTLTNATLAASAQPGDVVVVENSTIQAYNSYNNLGWQLRDSGTLLFAIKAVNGNDLTILYAQEMIYRAQSTTTILNRDLKTYFDNASNERGDIPSDATAGFSYDFSANGTTASQRWLGGTATLYRMFDSTIKSAWDTSGNSSAYAIPMLDVTGDFTPLWSSSGGGGGAASYFGNKALFAGSSNKNPGQIDTLDITTVGNATNFGSLGRYVYAMAAMSNGTRAVLAGGDNNTTDIVYVTFATYSTPATFGSTLATGNSGSFGGVSDGTYGVYPANSGYNGNSLEYITIATTSNGTDFGDMFNAADRRGGASDGTYGLLSGGRQSSMTTATDRFTIATPGNATDFGDNTLARMNISGMGDGTYAVFAGGLYLPQPYQWYNNIDYFTIATPGNATDFGDLVTGKSDTGATNNATRGVIAGGTGSSWQERDTIDYITIATPSNATSFGNLPTTKAYPSGTSGT